MTKALLKKFILIGCLLLVFFGCKSTKKVSDGSVNLKLSSKEVIKENSKNNSGKSKLLQQVGQHVF